MTVIDLHCHTTRPGPHSSLDPIVMITEAKRIGLGAVCVTEHEWIWERQDASQLSLEYGFPVFRGLEVGTELGHIAVFGLDRYVSGIHKLATLRKVADEVGGFLIVLHPFRRVFEPIYGRGKVSPSVEEAANWPVFQYVDEMEVLNGGSSEAENDFAKQVCKHLGMTGTGGSDAHSVHGLGCYTSVFEGEISSEEDLLRELRARRFRPATGLLTGELVFFGADDAAILDLRLQAEIEGERTR